MEEWEEEEVEGGLEEEEGREEKWDMLFNPDALEEDPLERDLDPEATEDAFLDPPPVDIL